MTFEGENLFIQGPDITVDLPRIDACHPVHYARRLLIFRCTSDQQRDAQIASLKIGLGALVQRCPLLAGKLSRLPPLQASTRVEEWRTIVPSYGLELVVEDLHEDMPSLEELRVNNFPSQHLPYELLVPIPKDIGSVGAACKVQYSIIEGGAILCWTMSHSVGDGAANNALLRILAQEVKRASVGDPSGEKWKVIDFDRSKVRDVKSDVPFEVEKHPGYRATPPSPTPSQVEARRTHPFRATAPEIPLLFKISSFDLARLKGDATPASPAWISTHDALVALIWRTQIFLHRQRSPAALELPDSTPTTLFMPSDARKALGLSDDYIGNAIYQLSATLPLSTLLSDTGLQAAALAIRQAITAVTPEKVKSYYAHMREVWVEWAFLDSFDTIGVAMGTAWTSSCLYEFDWGPDFGELVSYRMPNEPFNIVLPKLRGGEAELMISVMPEEVEKLKRIEDFMKYIYY